MSDEKQSLYYSDSIIRDKIDTLLRKNAALEASLGKDSTKKEFGKIKVMQADLFLKIKELDEDFYKTIVVDDDIH